MRRRLALTLGVATVLAVYYFREYFLGYLPATGGFAPPAFPTNTMNRNWVRVMLRAEAIKGGYDPDWFDAIAYAESEWRLDATNLSGPDGARGGAYGPMQMTSATAIALGYDPLMFVVDANYAGEAACRNFDDVKPNTFEDACSYWNAGVSKFANLPANHVTRLDYVPKAIKALALVRANPPTI